MNCHSLYSIETSAFPETSLAHVHSTNNNLFGTFMDAAIEFWIFIFSTFLFIVFIFIIVLAVLMNKIMHSPTLDVFYKLLTHNGQHSTSIESNDTLTVNILCIHTAHYHCTSTSPIRIAVEKSVSRLVLITRRKREEEKENNKKHSS